MTKAQIEEHIRQQVRNLLQFDDDQVWVATIITGELESAKDDWLDTSKANTDAPDECEACQ